MTSQSTTQSTDALAPLPIRCTSSDCDAGLHCFKATQKLRKQGREGACRSCGEQLVNWHRVHGRRLDDVDFTFAQLRLELIRHHFWHLDFDDKALAHALRKGRLRLHAAARQRLQNSVRRVANPWDGRQTPWRGNTIYYAQHAVAACCRTCIAYWHAIPKDHDLTEAELRYLTGLVLRYLDERLPGLPDEPQQVPRFRKSAQRWAEEA
jgi:Domain of unknown function (DUF4186)